MYCFICKKSITCEYKILNNKNMHPECFKCKKCKKIIDDSYMEKDNYNYHIDCYDELFGKKCFVCKEVIKGKYTYDDWGREAHITHNGKETLRCNSCNKILKLSFNKNIVLCHTCDKLVITSHKQVNKSLKKVITELSKVNLKIKNDNITIKVVSREEMSKLSSSLLSQGLASTRYTIYNSTHRKYEHTIYLIKDMTYLEFCGVLAHELLHTWQNEREIKLEKFEMEGFCNLGEYLIYKNDNSKLAKYYIKRMVNSSDKVYGEGFLYMKTLLDRFGWKMLINRVKNNMRDV